MKVIKSQEADAVRNLLMVLGFLHLLSIVVELFLYNIAISMIFTELVYLWLAYYCYMTMSPGFLWAYIVLLLIGTGIGVLGVLSIGGWFLVYIGQLAADGFLAYSLGMAVKEWGNSKHQSKDEARRAEEAKQPTGDELKRLMDGDVEAQVVNKVSEKVALNLIEGVQ